MYMDPSLPLKDIVVMYHAHCPDGMTAAWCAWKKFADTASYIPVSNRNVPPEGLINKELYVLDFCYPASVLKKLLDTNKKILVLDHHITCKEDVLSIPGSFFDNTRSGSGMSWDYFFEGTPRPKLLNYIEIGDLNPHNLPEGEHLSQRIIATPFTVNDYDDLISRYEKEPDVVVNEGKIIDLYVARLFDMALDDYEMVTFEGYTMPAINIALPLTTKSQLLMRMYEQVPPIAMSYRYENGFWKVSLRSDGSVDCEALASKYGGGGHRASAGFIIRNDLPLPFAKHISEK